MAVARIVGVKFPMHYTLSGQNVMFRGIPFRGDMLIDVRLDKDGDALSKTPGDLLGVYGANPATVGANDVNILLDRRIPAPPG